MAQEEINRNQKGINLIPVGTDGWMGWMGGWDVNS